MTSGPEKRPADERAGERADKHAGERGGEHAGEHAELRSARGRWILFATVLGSGLALLDSTVVNVALPYLGRELDAGMAGLQWTINSYTLTLAGLILLGGSLGDRYGRRTVFVIGVVWFAVASALCGLSPSIEFLIGARALQGIGGALLTPGSLAIIQASFVRHDRPRAVGTWSGLGGVASAIGPLLGGWLVQTAGWRWAFLINLPFAALIVFVALRHVPESKDEQAAGRFDVLGSVLAALALAGITYGLIQQGAPAPLLAGLLLGAAFVAVQVRRSPDSLVPVDIFRDRVFTAVNVVTLIMYAAMGVVFFLLVVQLQVVSGFSPIAAGLAMLPTTILMMVLSGRAGELAKRIGPRWPMTGGILLAGAGFLWMSTIGYGASYPFQVLPAVSVFGLGLSGAVAPLTATVLATVEDRHAGTASGVNNAVARTGSLFAVAAVPPVVGLVGDAFENPPVFDAGFRAAMLISAAMMVVAALITFFTIRSNVLAADD
ncbi:DHA2 family efflux MFS transporter permease subunit [Nonomuraea mesophila]|uniref:DHA2 family efflux MFS transporter permease subunit n=1 Tax=Nonomuraea mesophila TaxID=2530382 RepID=A0A4R5E8C4_9ACTN|nr:MFS transporter [Nonomuraea mesophila]TDE27612.1 DHA2 family efflux MFS transporter permease subunit [Nonomuraea mesophila]